MAQPADIVAVSLPILVGVSLIALAVVVIRNGGDHRHNLFFAALYSLSGIKSFSEGIDQVADGFNATSPLFPPTLFWQLLASFAALAMLPLLCLFVASFPRPVGWMTRRPALGALAFLPSLILGAILVAAVRDPKWIGLFQDAVPVFNLLSVGLTVTALVLILRTRRGSPDPVERTQALYVVVGFLPAFVAGWGITALQFLGDAGQVDPATVSQTTDAVIHYLSPLVELLAAGAVGFAILKYNILGIKPGFRLGVKSFLVGFIFVMAFLTTQYVESVVLEGQLFAFAGKYGFLLSAVSGIVLFKPIERVSNRISERLLPPATDAAALTSRAAEIYRVQCNHVLRDATVTERELALLRNLREQLGLTEGQARSIEEEVERRLHVDAPETGASSTTATRHVARAQAEVAQAPVEVVRASPLPPASRPVAKAAPKKSSGATAAKATKASPAKTAPPQRKGPAPKAAKKAAAKRSKP